MERYFDKRGVTEYQKVPQFAWKVVLVSSLEKFFWLPNIFTAFNSQILTAIKKSLLKSKQ